MSDNNAITPLEDKPILNIFATDEDKNGTDLLEMSNFFDLFLDDIGENIHTNYQWQDVMIDFGAMFGRFAAAIKAGFDINDIPDKDRIDFNKGYTDIDVVYEVMLRQFDIPLSTPIEKLSSVSDRTYIFADAVVVCLEPDIDEKLIERLAAIEPTPAKYVLRDSAFNDDIELKDVSFRRLSALIANHQTEEERKSKYNNYTVEFI